MEIQISVKEDKSELFLQIIKEFKDDMIEKFKILDNEFVSDAEQRDIEKVLASRSAEDKEVAFSKTITIDL